VVVSGRLMAEEAKTCFVLPLREAVAHFACWNTRSTETEEVGSSDTDNAHAGIDMAANIGAGFLPLCCKQEGRLFLQQDFGFFTKETIRRHTTNGDK
jgi:hypothetical protein